MDTGLGGEGYTKEENLTDMVESTENDSVDDSAVVNAAVHKEKTEDESTPRSDSSSEATIGRVEKPSWGQDEKRRANANTNGENLESMDSDQLRSKVEELNDTVEELEEELHQRNGEVNAKNEVLRRNQGIMRNMHMRHQQKDQKIQEMTSRLADLEKKVEAMEEFEKSLVKTMVNQDMKEIVETVKEQRERILQLEKKVREKEEEVEQAEALLDEVNEDKEERVTPAMLRLRGINVTLARGDEVRETTNTALEMDSTTARVGDGSARRMENGGGKPPAPLADILRANIGLTVQRPAGESEAGNESGEEGEEEKMAVNIGAAAAEEELRQTNPTDVADLLRARGVNIQRSAPTPTSSNQHSSMHEIEDNLQDDELFSDEEDDDGEEEGFSNGRNAAEKRPYNYIEEEKERRREKRMRDFEEEVKSDAFWSSMRDGQRDGEQDEELDDEADDGELGSGVQVWENGGLMVKEWEEEGRRVLQWEVDGWVEECPDCLRGWVHLCPNDANFPN